MFSYLSIAFKKWIIAEDVYWIWTHILSLKGWIFKFCNQQWLNLIIRIDDVFPYGYVALVKDLVKFVAPQPATAALGHRPWKTYWPVPKPKF